MPNLQKKEYVTNLYAKLKESPHFVLVGFTTTAHVRMEDLRHKLRGSLPKGEPTSFMVIKNSLFSVAFSKLNRTEKLCTPEEEAKIIAMVKNQSAVLFLPADWTGGIKAFYQFSKEEEGLVLKAGFIDGLLYEEQKLTQLAQLPSREELVIKVILSLRSSQTRIAYGLRFSAMKLVNVLRNAGEIKN